MGEIFTPGGIFSSGTKVGSFDDGKIYFNNEQIGTYGNGKINSFHSGFFSDSETEVGTYGNGDIYAKTSRIATYGDGIIFSLGYFSASQVATYSGNDEGAAAAYLICIYIKELEMKKKEEEEAYERWRNE